MPEKIKVNMPAGQMPFIKKKQPWKAVQRGEKKGKFSQALSPGI